MKTLQVTTPVGMFTRKTHSTYSHAVVRSSPRAMATFQGAQASGGRVWGVGARWVKDRGFAVTWHFTEQAARNAAAAPYMWDSATTLVGVFAVDAPAA